MKIVISVPNISELSRSKKWMIIPTMILVIMIVGIGFSNVKAYTAGYHQITGTDTGSNVYSDANGNVGINMNVAGGVVPKEKLDLYNAHLALRGSIGANGHYGGNIMFEYFDGTNLNALGSMYMDNNSASNQSLFLSASGTTKQLTVVNNGNVGIGTDNPGAKLQVSGGEVKLPAGSSDTSGGTMSFNLGGSGMNKIKGDTSIADTGGLVGIGTTSPSEKLEVYSGNLSFKPSSGSPGSIFFKNLYGTAKAQIGFDDSSSRLNIRNKASGDICIGNDSACP